MDRGMDRVAYPGLIRTPMLRPRAMSTVCQDQLLLTTTSISHIAMLMLII